MVWSFKKKKQADSVEEPAKKTSLFANRKVRDVSDAEDVEVVDVVETVEAAETVEASADALRHAVLEQETEVDAVAAQEVAQNPGSIDTSAKEKRRKWGRSKKPATRPAAATASPHKNSDGPRPIKVLIGFLPDSSEKDTYFYMLGVAQKNLDTENIGWAALMKLDNGFAYEIHEGGSGRGYLDSILSHFRSLPPFAPDEAHRAYIRTATRTVRIERTATGLYSVILPEADTTPESDWLVPGKKLAPLVEKRTGFFLGSIVIFMCGMIALTGAYFTRYQPHTASTVSVERVPVSKLPHSQWKGLTSIPPGDYVMAMKFENNEWLIQTPSNPSGRPAGTSGGSSSFNNAPGHSAGPNVRRTPQGSAMPPVSESPDTAAGVPSIPGQPSRGQVIPPSQAPSAGRAIAPGQTRPPVPPPSASNAPTPAGR